MRVSFLEGLHALLIILAFVSFVGLQEAGKSREAVSGIRLKEGFDSMRKGSQENEISHHHNYLIKILVVFQKNK